MRPGEKRPRDRWYRLRVDLQPAALTGRRAHVLAWRTRRGQVERYWASLELAGEVRSGFSLRAHPNAQGQPEAVLEAADCAEREAGGIGALLGRLVAGERTHEVLEW